jgi:hypothetical protein
MPAKKRPKPRPAAETTITAAPSDRADDMTVLSGDLQGLSNDAESESQSVRELVEEGQAFEAQVISGVENADPPDRRPIRTRQVPEDDVPREYTDYPPDEPREE